MTKHERLAGISLLLLGIAVIFYTLSHLQLGTLQEPGPGFFPVVCGAGIAVLSAFWVLDNLKSCTNGEPFWQKGQWVNPALAIGLITAYTALLEILGYLLSTVVFLLAWQRIIEREKWLKTGVIVVAGTAVMFILFSYLLGVPLPEGMFST